MMGCCRNETTQTREKRAWNVDRECLDLSFKLPAIGKANKLVKVMIARAVFLILILPRHLFFMGWR
jgi:hypothetical protein